MIENKTCQHLEQWINQKLIPISQPKMYDLVYDKAHEHHDMHKGALESVVREPRVYWMYEKKLVDSVISFVMSPHITQAQF